MRQVQALQQHGNILKGDDRLYSMEDGATADMISDDTHESTLQRWREWVAARDEAARVRQLIDETRDAVASGSLLNEHRWRDAANDARAKYNRLRQAHATRFPLSLQEFESASRKRAPDSWTPGVYQQYLTHANPAERLAHSFDMSIAEVEATKREGESAYPEWTFLARVVTMFVKKSQQNARACIELTLTIIDRLLNSTCDQQFAKAKISPDSTSHLFSAFSIDLGELEALTRFVAQQTQGGDDGQAQHKIMDALEVIWHIPVPNVVRDWLRFDPRDTVQHMLSR